MKEEPFRPTPDPKFLYMTLQHAEAFNHLRYGIYRRKGFMCLTGEVGTGKTTLCRRLLDELAANAQWHTALILNPMLNTTQNTKIMTMGLINVHMKPSNDPTYWVATSLLAMAIISSFCKKMSLRK